MHQELQQSSGAVDLHPPTEQDEDDVVITDNLGSPLLGKDTGREEEKLGQDAINLIFFDNANSKF